MKRLFLASFFCVLALAGYASAGATNHVHLRFFHTECHECDIVRDMLNVLTNEFFPGLVVHDYDFMVRSNYMLMVRLEQVLKIDVNEPVAIYIGSNCFYGLKPIQQNLVRSITNGLSRGGVPLWVPPDTKAPATLSSNDPVISRFRSFSIPLVAGAGLLDGVNPCAFATLILFVTLLSCYRSSRMDIILTSLVFSCAIFSTYLVLGLGLFSALETMKSYALPSMLLHWTITALCLLLAGFSLHDAWRVRHTRQDHDLALALPHSWRRTISRLLSTYVGHTRWLAGVFGVGVVIALVESVCTGQVYLPTIIFVLRTAEHHSRAVLYLVLYNLMFIVPILVLTALVLAGIHSQRLLAWQNRHAVAARLLMAALFAGLALLLVVTGLVYYA